MLDLEPVLGGPRTAYSGAPKLEKNQVSHRDIGLIGKVSECCESLMEGRLMSFTAKLSDRDNIVDYNKISKSISPT